jgi:hypothetical protein
MKVSDLVEKLKDVPGDLTVCVDGYEGGFTERITLKLMTVAVDVHVEEYYGEHDHPSPLHVEAETKEVLLLSRWGEGEW